MFNRLFATVNVEPTKEELEKNILAFTDCIDYFLQKINLTSATTSSFVRALAYSYLSIVEDSLSTLANSSLLMLINECYETALLINNDNNMALAELDFFSTNYLGFVKHHGFDHFRVPDYNSKELQDKLSEKGVRGYFEEFIEDHIDQLYLLLKTKIPALIPNVLYQLSEELAEGSIHQLEYTEFATPELDIAKFFRKKAAELGHKDALDYVNELSGACLIS